VVVVVVALSIEASHAESTPLNPRGPSATLRTQYDTTPLYSHARSIVTRSASYLSTVIDRSLSFYLAE